MPTLESLRKKIQSAEDLHTIVRTMKTLSSVNIRHYEKAVKSVAEYYRTVDLGLQVVLKNGPIDVLTVPEDKDRGLCAVIFGSDQGLCGGFNDHIVSHVLEVMNVREVSRERRTVVCIGSRAADLLEEEGQPVEKILPIPGSLAGITSVMQQIVMLINEWQGEGRIGSVSLFYNKPVSNISYDPHTEHLLPLEREWFQTILSKSWPSHVLPTFTMERGNLFSSLIRQYVFVSLYRACIESMASENASRAASMQAAEKNIEERLENLNALYRHQRQSSITDELLDIVSGFEALRSDKETS